MISILMIVFRNEKTLRKILDSDPRTKDLSFKLVNWDQCQVSSAKLAAQEEPKYYKVIYFTFALLDVYFMMFQVINEGVYDYQTMFRKCVAHMNSGRVVITDRLHQSIFAFLLNKPHVCLDQSYGKIV